MEYFTQKKEYTKEELAGKIKNIDKDFSDSDNTNYVFISYSKEDFAFVYPIVLALRARGYNIQLDTVLKRIYDNSWFKTISEIILNKKCKRMFSFITENYIKSIPCALEQLCALAMRHTNSDTFIIPITKYDSINNIKGFVYYKEEDNSQDNECVRSFELLKYEFLRYGKLTYMRQAWEGYPDSIFPDKQTLEADILKIGRDAKRIKDLVINEIMMKHILYKPLDNLIFEEEIEDLIDRLEQELINSKLEPNSELIEYMKENHPEFSSYVEQASPKATKSIQKTVSKRAKKDEEVIKESAKEEQTQSPLNSDESSIEKGISKVITNPEEAQFYKIFLTNLNKELRAKLQKEDSDKLILDASRKDGHIVYNLGKSPILLKLYLNKGHIRIRLEFQTNTIPTTNDELLAHLQSIDNNETMWKSQKEIDYAKAKKFSNFNIQIEASENPNETSSKVELEAAKELLRIIIESKKK